ncbi:hypothetical protein VNI00_012659 [Paramarasmius palmivorus]|uniref:Transferase n=1 Tax=Paramarasmius palmivorus TaxID=297713 RepID=A0AAW0C546_9AGAR
MTIETYTIQPTSKHARPPPPTSIPLHGFDLIAAPLQIRNHRFFRRPASPHLSNLSSIVDLLKDSLAEALELYPVVAGIVRTNDKGEVYIATDADQGTPFFVEVKNTPFIGDAEDIGPRQETVLPPESSTLAVKVTQFSCGTIAVASSIHHQTTDLRGFLDFLELWALIARGEPIDYSRIPSDWTHTPARFFDGLRDRSSPPQAPPAFSLVDTRPTSPPAAYLAPSGVMNWKFSKDAVERLKRDFSPTSTSSKDWISSGDALAALFWSSITRARESANIPRLEGRSPLDAHTELLVCAADGRERAPNGSMANGQYFGNFNPLFGTYASRDDLLSPENAPGSRVALAVRQALNAQLSPEALAEKIAFFEAVPPESGRIVWTADVILTNWSRNDLGGPKLDFGWGQAFKATCGSGGVFPPGYVLMTQDRETGDMVAMMTIETDAVDALKQDVVLRRYGSLV